MQTGWKAGPTVASPIRCSLFVMVTRNLIREFDITEEEEDFAIGTAMPDELDWLKGGDVGPNQIVEGRVLRIDDDFVLVDVGYKSEGIIPRNEWEEGDEIPKV